MQSSIRIHGFDQCSEAPCAEAKPMYWCPGLADCCLSCGLLCGTCCLLNGVVAGQLSTYKALEASMTGGKSKRNSTKSPRSWDFGNQKMVKHIMQKQNMHMVLYLRLDGRDKRGQSLFRGQISLSLSLSLSLPRHSWSWVSFFKTILIHCRLQSDLSSPILPTLNIAPGSFQESVECWSIRVDATP